MARLKTSLCFTLALSALALPGLASAADIDAGDMDEEDSEEAAGAGASEESTEEGAPGEAASAPVEGTEPKKKEWDPNALQFEVGVRGRLLVVPKFLINAFQVQGGQDIVVGGIGAEGGISKGNLEALLGVWYAGYKAGPMPFKGPTDGNEAWEIIQSNLGMLYITGDLLFRGEIAKGWHWFFGGSAGIGIVTGNLKRNEAYWTNGASAAFPGDPYTQLAPCTGAGFSAPGTPNPIECPAPENGDNRYDFFTGQNSPVWPVYPWLTMQMGARYQPHKNLITRLDLGIGSSGFWLGLAVDYGL